MLALVYLIVMMVLGACICERFYSFTSLPHHLAASFLVGLVLNTWVTYLFALPFFWSDRPLVGKQDSILRVRRFHLESEEKKK